VTPAEILSGYEVRRAREALGYSQRDLAEALQMGPNGADRIRDWEQGKRPISGPASVAIRLMLDSLSPPNTTSP
jgi:DNA-binding transcriptional regulator YiaG